MVEGALVAARRRSLPDGKEAFGERPEGFGNGARTVFCLPGRGESANLPGEKEESAVPIMDELPAEEGGPDRHHRGEAVIGPVNR